jgi:hypothetical protein
MEPFDSNDPFSEASRAAPEPEPKIAKTAIIPVGPKGVEFKDVDAMYRFAQCYIQSGFAPPAFRRPQQLVIAWVQALELGLTPLQAMHGMYVVNNQIGLRGALALALVEASGELQDIRKEYTGEGDSLVCTLTIQRKGREAHQYSFSVEEAKQAGLLERSPVWRTYPKRMTYYRALGFGLQDEFADILKGIKTVEELQDYPENNNHK